MLPEIARGGSYFSVSKTYEMVRNFPMIPEIARDVLLLSVKTYETVCNFPMLAEIARGVLAGFYFPKVQGGGIF